MQRYILQSYLNIRLHHHHLSRTSHPTKILPPRVFTQPIILKVPPEALSKFRLHHHHLSRTSHPTKILPPRVFTQPIILKVPPEALSKFLAILLSLMVVVRYIVSSQTKELLNRIIILQHISCHHILEEEVGVVVKVKR
jgi:hypothetical protein